MSARSPRPLAAPVPAALAWCPHCACLDAPNALALEDGEIVASCARCAKRFTLGRVEERAPKLRLVEREREQPPPPTPRARWLPVDLTELELDLALRSERHEEALSVPDGHCPRCVAPRGAASACASCGLDFERMSLDALQPPTWLRERWLKTWLRWNDEGLHADLLERATRSGELAALGRLYRLRLARMPGDAVAERARVEVVRRASLPLAAPRTDFSAVRRRRLIAGTLVLVTTLVGLVVVMLR